MNINGLSKHQCSLFPPLRMTSSLGRGGPPGKSICAQSWRMNEYLLIIWLEHFISNFQPSFQNPTLLITDNHSDHTSLSSYYICKDNGIIVVSSPYHTTCKMQPLYVYFLGPLKPAYSRECGLFKRIHLHEAIHIKEIPSLYNTSYQKNHCHCKRCIRVC
jgi:hypothetical protein